MRQLLASTLMLLTPEIVPVLSGSSPMVSAMTRVA